MTAKKKITDKNGVQVFPITHTRAVLDDNGNSVEERLQENLDLINQKQLEVGAVPSDVVPTDGSTNWVTSGGVFSSMKNNSVSDDLLEVVVENTAYSTDDIFVEGILWNTTINVGQTFNDETARVTDANSAAYKVEVHAGEEVVFNVKPAGYGNYGRSLLTDVNNKVLKMVGRDSISAGYTWAVTADGYLYCHFGKTVQNPFNIIVKDHYRSNKYLTGRIGKAEAIDVTYNNTNSDLYSDNVQNAIDEIAGTEIDVTYSYKGTGRFNSDGTINANGDYRYTNPIILKSGASIVVKTYVASQYGFIALTDENGSSYTVVAINRSPDGVVERTYTATEDCFVSVALKINNNSNKIKYRYPNAIIASKVSYNNSNTPIITGSDVQTAMSQLYNLIAGSFTVNYSNKGEGFVNSSTKTITSNGYFKYTNPLHLMQGDEITVTTNITGYIAIVSKTDSEGSYFEPVVVDTADGYSVVRTYTYTASEDCYVVISHGINYSTYEIRYLKRFIYDILGSTDSQIKKDGGDFLVLGDSITADVNGWTKYVTNTYGLSLTNIAVAGSVWCSYPPFRVDLSGSFTDDHGLNNIENQMYRFLQMITPEGEVVPELSEDMTYVDGYSYPILGTGELDRDNIKLIGISCGGNDNNLSYQDGDLNTICNQSDIRAVDRSTMRGVIRWACVLLQYYCPNARIFMLTPIPNGRSNASMALERVGNNIKTVAYRLGVNVIDMQYCGVSSAVAGMTRIPGTNNESRYFRDGLHVNGFGQKLMGNYVCSMLNTWWKY